MVSINYAFKEIISKIVYYGPGLSGKTSNLQYVFKKVPSETRGELISLATDADRTLYFDFLPVNVGTIQGFATKFQLYTVPGQVYYNATRKLVLRGVDGLVFVADSQLSKMEENAESLSNLKDNLEEYGYDIAQIPMIIQYNKRDLPDIASIPELEKALNPRGVPYFEAVAVTGDGVFKTLKAISKLVLDQVRSKKTEPGRTIVPQPEKVLVSVPPDTGKSGPSAKKSLGMTVENIAPAVEVPSSVVDSYDNIGTRRIEPAVVIDNETSANVVVSDSPTDKKPYHDELRQNACSEENTEKAVMNAEAPEAEPKSTFSTDGMQLTNEYSEVEIKPAPEPPRYYDSAFAEATSIRDDAEMPAFDITSPLSLGKPQMAESRKVKGRKSPLNIFGWFKKSKK